MFTTPLDPEIVDRLDPREPLGIAPSHSLCLVPDEYENPIPADPVLRTAPEGKSARIVSVVAEDGRSLSQGMSDLGALVPVSAKNKSPRVVDQSELADPAGD